MLRVIALLCNIAVVSASVFLFWKNGHIRWNKILPLVVLSIPAAFAGGYLRITERFFFIALGIILIVTALAMWIRKPSSSDVSNSKKKGELIRHSAIGGGIGFLAGLVGIGGGIFLSPVLHLMNWDRAKIISATSAFFILVNSISGLLGQFQRLSLTDLNLNMMLWLLVAVIFGGQAGSRLGIHIFKPILVRRLTSVLVIYVGIRLVIRHVFLS